MRPKATRTLGIRIPVQLDRELREFARQERNGISALIRRLLSRGIERERQEHVAQSR